MSFNILWILKDICDICAQNILSFQHKLMIITLWLRLKYKTNLVNCILTLILTLSYNVSIN